MNFLNGKTTATYLSKARTKVEKKDPIYGFEKYEM